VIPFEWWRREARAHLQRNSNPETVDWSAIMRGATVLSADGCASRAADGTAPGGANGAGAGSSLRISAALLDLLQKIGMYRVEGRWELMYRLLWRSVNENARLLEDFADRDVSAAIAMERTVRREIHKMHAFVRFREVPLQGEAPRYVAWFEPRHDVLVSGAGFFAQRFPNMRWTIATPDGAAVWESGQLRFIEGPIPERAAADGCEGLWRAYYRSICNQARLKPAAMRREMPKRYWKHLPEAVDIAGLMRSADPRLLASGGESRREGLAMGKSIKASLNTPPLPDEALNECRRCNLWQHATQAVPGEGGRSARIMLVGEQPGDEEDLRGRPFVGPAGQVLDQAIAAAGLVRGDLFITNAVKHFKWEPRGRRRLHKKPAVGEIDACHGWLDGEIAAVKPAVIVALGSTALRSLTGTALAVGEARRRELAHPSGARILATYHPSAILRADERAPEFRAALIEDLRRAADLALARS
jgi:DNA polymerase